MEEFGAIEDEFLDSNEKLTIEPKNYKALLCEPGWFLSDENQSNKTVNIKFKADYLYMRGNYKEAIQAYNTYINECPESLTNKRECLEGISRSCLAEHCYCCALKYAIQLQTLSSTFDSHTVGLTLLLDCSLGAGRYKDAVTYGQKLVTLHSLNSDTWIKLSFGYAKLYGIPLLLVCQSMDFGTLNDNTNCTLIKNYLNCECTISSENNRLDIINEKKTNTIANCLLHAEFHLKSVEGSAFGISLKQNLEVQERIRTHINSFNFDIKCLERLTEGIRKKYAGTKYTKDNTMNDFIDRESSKFSNKENVILEEFYGNDFEDEWFV